jgi:hypothetical protein
MAALMWLRDLFFPRKLGRLSYFLRSGAFAFLFYGIMIDSDFSRGVKLAIEAPLALYDFVFVIVPRARDCELNRWLLVAILIPGLNLVLSLILLFKKASVKFVLPPETNANLSGDDALNPLS